MPHNGEEEKKKPPEKKPDRTNDIFKAISAAGQFLSNVSPGGGGGVQMIPGQVGGAPQQLARPFPGPGAAMPQQVRAPSPGPRAGHPAFQMGTSFPTKQARTGAVVSGAIQNITQAVSRWKGARVAQKKALMSNKVAQLLTAIENNDKETIRAYLTDEKFMKEAEKFVQFSLPDAPKKEAPPEVAGFQDAIIKSAQGGGGGGGGGQAGGGRVVGGKLLPSPDAAAMLRNTLLKGMHTVAGRSPEAAAQMGGAALPALLPGAEAVEAARVGTGVTVSPAQKAAQEHATTMGKASRQHEATMLDTQIQGKNALLAQQGVLAMDQLEKRRQSGLEYIKARGIAAAEIQNHMAKGEAGLMFAKMAKFHSNRLNYYSQVYREYVKLGEGDSKEALSALEQMRDAQRSNQEIQDMLTLMGSSALQEIGFEPNQ